MVICGRGRNKKNEREKENNRKVSTGFRNHLRVFKMLKFSNEINGMNINIQIKTEVVDAATSAARSWMSLKR